MKIVMFFFLMCLIAYIMETYICAEFHRKTGYVKIFGQFDIIAIEAAEKRIYIQGGPYTRNGIPLTICGYNN